MVLINWLFGSAEAFWQAQESAFNPQIALPTTDFPSDHQSEGSNKDPRREQLIGLLTVQKQSLRMAARAIGIDVGTAMSWAAQAGLTVPRRPKKLFGEVRQRAIAELQKGNDKAIVAAAAQISVVTVTKLLLSEVGLHAAWRQAKDDRARPLPGRFGFDCCKLTLVLAPNFCEPLNPRSTPGCIEMTEHGWTATSRIC